MALAILATRTGSGAACEAREPWGSLESSPRPAGRDGKIDQEPWIVARRYSSQHQPQLSTSPCFDARPDILATRDGEPRAIQMNELRRGYRRCGAASAGTWPASPPQRAGRKGSRPRPSSHCAQR